MSIPVLKCRFFICVCPVTFCACVCLQLYIFKHLYLEEIMHSTLLCTLQHILEMVPDQNMLDFQVILNCCFIFCRRAVLSMAVLASITKGSEAPVLLRLLPMTQNSAYLHSSARTVRIPFLSGVASHLVSRKLYFWP